MKLLTRADFDRRSAELIDAKDLAEAEYRRQCFAQATDTATAEEVDKAKRQLDAIEGKIAGLNAAWQESQKQMEVNAQAAREKAFKQLTDEVALGLGERADAMKRIEKHAVQLARAITDHETVNEALRRSVAGFRTQSSAAVAGDGLRNALDSTRPARTIAASLLAVNGVAASSLAGERDTLSGTTPAEVEQRQARKLLEHVALFAPEQETA
jgi:TolA-binding protein